MKHPFFTTLLILTSLLLIQSAKAEVKYSGGAGDGFGAAASAPASLGGTPISLTLPADQIVERTLQMVPCGTVTITDGSPAAITATGDLRLTIPNELLQTWDTAISTPTFGGSAVGSVAGTVSYANGDQTLVIDVTSNFNDGDTLTINGLAFTNLIQACIPEALVLDITNDGIADASSDKLVGVTVLRPGGFGNGSDSFMMAENVAFVVQRAIMILVR